MLTVAHDAPAPTRLPGSAVTPNQSSTERPQSNFTPRLRALARTLHAADGPVPLADIREVTGLTETGVTSIVAALRTVVGPIGTTIVVEQVEGARAYRFVSENRAALERLIGATDLCRNETHRGLSGLRARFLRMLEEAGGTFVSAPALIRVLWGGATRRSHENLKTLADDVRRALEARPDGGGIASRGTGYALAYAWIADAGRVPEIMRGPVQRVDGVTLPPIGCQSWRYHPATQSRHYAAHVVRLRNELADRVLTDRDQTADPLLTPFSAKHGVWPPASEEREAA